MKIVQKKTYWLNTLMSVYFLIGLLGYIFFNIDYVESTWLDKMVYVVMGFLLASTILTFQRNDIGMFWKTSLLFNLIFLLGAFVAFSRGLDKEYSHLLGYSVFMVIYSGINLKSLFALKETNRYLEVIPFLFFIVLILIAIFFVLQPYITHITFIVRVFIAIGLLVLTGWKFKLNNAGL